MSTVIIGCEADFSSRKRIPAEEATKLIQRLKDYLNLSYDSEATIAAEIGVSRDAMSGWLPNARTFRKDSNVGLESSTPLRNAGDSFASLPTNALLSHARLEITRSHTIELRA